MDAKHLLKQYTDLQSEIKDLEKRIKKLENFKVEHDKVTDPIVNFLINREVLL